MDARLSRYSLLLLGVVAAGCTAPISRTARPDRVLPDVYSSELYEKLKELDTDSLIRLVGRADPELEVRLLGKLDARIVNVAADELVDRFKRDVFSDEQRHRVIEALREPLRTQIEHGGFGANMVLWGFAAKYDTDYTAHLIWRERDQLRFGLEDAVKILSDAGHEDWAYELILPRLNSGDEGTVCEALWVIGDQRMKKAADAVFQRTRALRWLIRLEALRALDCLDDPRTTQALQDHLADIKRTSIGHRILWLPTAEAAIMRLSSLRGDLVMALADRKIPGAEKVLEYIVLKDAGLYFDSPRWPAAEGLMKLNRPKGLEAIGILLRRRSEKEQALGVELADITGAGELKDQLRSMAATSKYESVRDRASQALSSWEPVDSKRTRQ
ncbi:MAG: hypothetical protein JW955_18485 [Sedimentisphaerales bacterium]|nr:hypothetical protein [Sedimentisphaerales bacterium]